MKMYNRVCVCYARIFLLKEKDDKTLALKMVCFYFFLSHTRKIHKNYYVTPSIYTTTRKIHKNYYVTPSIYTTALYTLHA